MSEAVHFHIENQLPELRDLLEKEIFSSEDIKEIVRKRTKFEYKLKRRVAEKSDFLAYIKYEKELEALRKRRVEEFGIKSRHSVSDHSIRQHIYHIYKRAVTKFKGDIQLWLEYIDYALASDGKSVLDRIFASALSLHPLNEAFWIKAATWEFTGKGNAAAARMLYQKGVRASPNSVNLWLSFFIFELEYASQLLERREILGLNQSSKDLSITDAKIALLVHRHSLKALHSIELQEKMFMSARNYSRFSTLLEGMRANIETSPAVNDAAFKQLLLDEKSDSAMSSCECDDEKLKKILSELSCAYSSCNSSVDVSNVISFLERFLSCEDEVIRTAIADKIDQILQLAQERCLMTPDLYLKWVDISQTEGVDSCDIILEGFSRFPDSDPIAYLFAKYQLRSRLQWSEILKTVEKASNFEPDFWHLFFEYIADEETVTSIVINIVSRISLEIIHLLPLEIVLAKMVEKNCDIILFCDELLNVRAIGNVLYPLIIKVESSKSDINTSLLYSLYEKTVALMPGAESHWIGYMKFCAQNLDMQRLGAVYKRASSAISASANMIASYDELLHSL